MTDIRDNPPPLPKTKWKIKEWEEVYQAGQAAAFERGKAAMQGEIDDWKSSHADACRRFERSEQTLREVREERDELRAKLKALEEQLTAWRNFATANLALAKVNADAGAKP